MCLKAVKTLFVCALLTAITLGLLARTTAAQQNPNSDLTFSVEYTNSSFTIRSASAKGNFSFAFKWENTDLYIEYNNSRRMIRELKLVAFTDETARYAMEFWIPRMFYEYVDADNNVLFIGSSNIEWTMPGPDIYVIGYKIDVNIDMTNITQTQKEDGTTLLEWMYTQLAMPMESNVQGPWERFPTVKEVFHYNPFNGTLKMDIVLDNFKPRNNSSRVFLSYGLKYVPLQPIIGNLTVVADGQEFQLAQLNRVYPTNSTVIAFKVDGIDRAFFDFGGIVTVDGNSNIEVKGSIGPPDMYWLNERDVWLAIGLNYPHVNRTLVHDPYFGLSQAGLATVLPITWTVATAGASIALLVIVAYNYRKTKNLFKIPNAWLSPLLGNN